jgi:6-phosphogluconolactonase
MSIHKHVYADPQETSAACAKKILQLLGEKLAHDSKASLAISGGTTPKLLFGELAKAKFDWSKVHLFWVDERGVPPTDSQSNYKLAKENLIDAAHIPASNVHRIQAELAPDVAAKLYADDITQFFGLAKGAIPRFDIIHRGMGPDAHTASLFPGEAKIDDHTNITGEVYVEKFKQWRITLLPAVLEAAHHTIMLVAGADKAEPLKQVMYGAYEPKKYPCQIAVQKGGDVIWFLDEPAARLVKDQ